MNSSSTQYATSRMGIYEPFHQISTWGDAFNGGGSPHIGASTIVQADDRQENKESVEPSGNGQEANKPADKVQRRLAQNREAARKSRLRKKAYLRQLETSRQKLAQLEQELERARHQGVYIGSALDTIHTELSGTVNSGIAVFEMEYGHWVVEQQRQICELKIALQAHITEIELRMLVENVLNHYYNLFQMKAEAAKADVFYVLSGKWRTSAESFFLWIGGFRPSELLNVLMPQLEPLTDEQHLAVSKLRHSSQQAEDALSQGMEKLQQALAHSIATEPVGGGSHGSQMASSVEKLEALESFVIQADHLRQQTLRQVSRVLTTHQAALGLLALGEYFHRLRALSSLWAASPRELA